MTYAVEHDEMLEVAEAMERYGGKFIRTLGSLLRYADLSNLRKLKATFPEYWKEYKEKSEILKARK